MDQRGNIYLAPTPLDVQIEQVEREVAEVCGALNAAHARLVELTATVLHQGLWRQAGIVSPAIGCGGRPAWA